MDFIQYLQVIRKNLLWILSFVIIASATSAWVSYNLVPTKYESSVRIIVNSSDKLDLGAVNTNILLINTFKELVKSPTVLNRTIAEYPELNLSIDQLEKSIKVVSSKDSQLLTISVTMESYEYGTKVVNAISKVFQEQVASMMQIYNILVLPDDVLNSQTPKVASKQIINILLAFVVSLLISVGFVIGKETLDQTIRNTSTLDNILGVPSLGTISKITKKETKKHDMKSVDRKVGDATYAKLS